MRVKKSTATIIIVSAVLLAAVCVLAVLNADRVKKQNAGCDSESFIIKAGGKSYTADRALLEDIGIVTFTANRKSNGQAAVKTEYQGVLLKDICGKLGIDLSEYEDLAATAADGYPTAASVKKINEPDNVYIASGQDGKHLAGKDDGGDGPYMLVVVKDPFSQYWCKYLTELEFK